MVEVHVGPLHAADLQQSLQRPVRARRHRRGHRALRALRLLRHLQRSTLDAEAGAFHQQLVNICTFCWLPWLIPSLSPPQYAVFLALVFMTELIAGISGFIFRHEVTPPPPLPPIPHISTSAALSPWQQVAFMRVGVCPDQRDLLHDVQRGGDEVRRP